MLLVYSMLLAYVLGTYALYERWWRARRLHDLPTSEPLVMFSDGFSFDLAGLFTAGALDMTLIRERTGIAEIDAPAEGFLGRRKPAIIWWVVGIVPGLAVEGLLNTFFGSYPSLSWIGWLLCAAIVVPAAYAWVRAGRARWSGDPTR